MGASQWQLPGLLPGVIGPLSGGTDNQFRQNRLSKDGSVVQQDGHGRYVEPSYRGTLNAAVNSAAQALSLTGTTTYTGLVVYNPPGSGKNLFLLEAIFAGTIVATGVGGVLMFSQAIATTVPTLTTTNVSTSPFSAVVGNGSSSVAKVASSCTLAANPIFLRPLISNPWITGTDIPLYCKDEIGGSLAIPPGAGVGFVALTTATTGIAYLSWEEVSL